MRRIVTAISAAALAFSLVATATPANAAVAGYDSTYLAQSDWLVRSQGQTGSWTVIVLNSGTTTWTRGTSTEVELAACLENKTSCNQQDATEAPFNNGWLSATRYADMNQTVVAPGQTASFTVNILVPAGQAGGIYRFNAAVVKADTSEDIRNVGLFFDVNVPGPAAGGAATLTSLSQTSGSSSGGTAVTITGTGFVCTPVFPTVNFGSNLATVTACGATTLSTTSPAGAVGATSVTVTNNGAAASNALTYTYTDTTAPVYTSVAVTGGATNAIATLTFSEPVCEISALAPATDFEITVNGIERTATGDTLNVCNAAGASATNAVTSFSVSFPGPIVNGDVVAVTLLASGAGKIRDLSSPGNSPLAQTRTVTATADTTKPSISSATASGSATMTLTYTEPVECTGAEPGQFTRTPTGGTLLAATGLTCTAGPTGSTTVTLTFPGGSFASGVGGTVTYTAGTAAARVKDVVGNEATTPQSVTYTAFSVDAGAPTMVDTRLTSSAGFGTQLDAGDVFKIAFSEAMNTDSAGDIIRVTDADGTVADLTCGGNVTCSWNTTGTEGLGGVTYAANTVLTVHVLTTPTALTGFNGTVAGMQLPATITDTSGITDAAGNSVNVAGSADRVIDIE